MRILVALTPADTFPTVTRIFDAARAFAPHVLYLAHGGPLATPRETAELYRRTDAVGFVAASSIERLPTEDAVLEQARGFKSQQLAPRRRNQRCG